MTRSHCCHCDKYYWELIARELTLWVPPPVVTCEQLPLPYCRQIWLKGLEVALRRHTESTRVAPPSGSASSLGWVILFLLKQAPGPHSLRCNTQMII